MSFGLTKSANHLSANAAMVTLALWRALRSSTGSLPLRMATRACKASVRARVSVMSAAKPTVTRRLRPPTLACARKIFVPVGVMRKLAVEYDAVAAVTGLRIDKSLG